MIALLFLLTGLQERDEIVDISLARHLEKRGIGGLPVGMPSARTARIRTFPTLGTMPINDGMLGGIPARKIWWQPAQLCI